MVHVCWLHRVRIIVFYVCFFFYFAIGKRQRWHGCGLARPLHSTTERAHSSEERSRVRLAGGTCARFGHSWIPVRAAWRKRPSEHVPLPSPHETPASLSCFIQCRRRGCSLQIYCVVDGTPASIVRALRVQIVDRDFENLELNINNLIRLNSQIILLTVDPFIR